MCFVDDSTNLIYEEAIFISRLLLECNRTRRTKNKMSLNIRMFSRYHAMSFGIFL
jgi:hypothetical protein